MYWTKNEQNPQKISIIFDLSESMFSHLNNYPERVKQIQEKINIWGTQHDLNIDFFQLGKKITKLNNMKSVYPATDYMDLPNFISFEQPQQILLITDGKATVGKNINEIKFSHDHPIHTVGVGPVHINIDIGIQDIILPDLLVHGDTVNIKVRIQSTIEESIHSNFQILNELGHQIYLDRIIFEEGNRLQDLEFEIPTDLLNGVNLARIYPVNGETKIANNNFSFRGNLQESVDDILLITGALSQNSKIIKGLLDDVANTNLYHSFRMNKTQWNKEPFKIKYNNLKLIVLDDFPIQKEDSQLFMQILTVTKDEDIPIVYIQGPWANLTSSEIIRSKFPSFVPKAEDPDVLMGISTQSTWLQSSGIILNKLPPQKRSIKWIQSEKPWLSYIDESLLIGNKNNFYLVSMPELVESHFKININTESIISQILKKVILHAFHGSEDLIGLEINRKYFNKGEKVLISLMPIKGIDLMNFDVKAFHEKDTIILECIEKVREKGLRCSTTLKKSGLYTFTAQASLHNGKQVYSSSKSAIVQDVKIEMKELIQKRKSLMEVSHKTGGTYRSIDSLDNILTHIDITPIQLLKKHQISALSLHNYWWALILLFSIEWYFRKKLGLL